jgi:hypothetical protein
MSETAARDAGTGRRYALFTFVFLLFALATPMLIFQNLDDFGVEEVEVGADVINVLREALPALGDNAQTRGAWDVAFLGDSMVVSYPPGKRVPDRLKEAVEQTRGRRPRLNVVSLAAPGMGPFDYYFVADLVARAHPDQVILPFNLAALSDPWRGTFSRPELAGWLAPARVPNALTLPLEWVGLTTDRLFFYVGIVQSGGERLWRGTVKQQARLGRARTLVASRLEKSFRSTALMNFGTARFRYSDKRNVIRGYPAKDGKPGRRKRLTRFGLRQRYGPALDGIRPGNPAVEVLAAAVRRFRRDGIRVLVYASPANIANMETGGVLDEEGLQKTLEVIAGAVRAEGGEFADFHALLPDEAFRDAAGHFSVKANLPDGPLLLGRALAPLVVEEARSAKRGVQREAQGGGD